MAKTFLVSTTGAGTFTIADLGGRALLHPIVSLDLALEYSLEELRDSTDLRSLINAGDLTVVFDGENITDNATFDEFMVDFDHSQVKANTDAIAALNLTGNVTWSYAFGEDGNLNGDRYIKTVAGVFSNISPYIVPINCTLYAISLAAKQGTADTFNVIVEKNAITAHTEAVAAADKEFTSGLAVAFTAGDEVSVKFDHTGDNVENLTVSLYFEEA